MSDTKLVSKLIIFINKHFKITIDLNDILNNEIHIHLREKGVDYEDLNNKLERNNRSEIIYFLHVNEKLQEILLNNKYGAVLSEIPLSAKFFKDLGFDSLDLAELMIDFELVFNITIPIPDAEQLLTILDGVNYIFDKLYMEL